MARALADVAGALAEKGCTSEAVQLTRTAADFARTTTITRWRAWALRDVAIALTKAARIEESIELAEVITESGDRAKALAALTEMLAKTERVEEAARLAHHAVNVARSEPNASERCAAPAAVAASMVATGQSDEAVSLADALVEEHSTLTSVDAAVGIACVAEALAQAGRTPEAVSLAERAVQMARATTEIFGQDAVLSIVVNALVKAGQPTQAVRAANTISDPARRAPALAKTAAAYGLTAEGRSLLRRALSASTGRPPTRATHTPLADAPDAGADGYALVEQRLVGSVHENGQHFDITSGGGWRSLHDRIVHEFRQHLCLRKVAPR